MSGKAATPVLDVALRPADEGASGSLMSVIERVAMTPEADVTKLERLIAMQERVMAHNAKSAFDAAFATMQPEIPEIDERGKIAISNRGTQSTYARNEDIQRVLRPILAKHGFALNFRTEWPEKAVVRVVGILSHRDGHSRESVFQAGADDSGSKNAVQALGSTITYGRRYTTCDLLNITSRLMDDDATTAVPTPAGDAPDGFYDWLDDLEAASDEGWPKLSAAFNKSPEPKRTYLMQAHRQRWNTMKGKAERIRRGES